MAVLAARNLDPSLLPNVVATSNPIAADIGQTYPGADLTQVGTITGSWVSTPFDTASATQLTFQISQAGSLEGYFVIQGTTDLGLPLTFQNNGLGSLIASRSNGAPQGGFYNWLPLFTSPVFSGNDSEYITLDMEDCAWRAMRFLYVCQGGSGQQILGVIGKGRPSGY